MSSTQPEAKRRCLGADIISRNLINPVDILRIDGLFVQIASFCDNFTILQLCTSFFKADAERRSRLAATQLFYQQLYPPYMETSCTDVVGGKWAGALRERVYHNYLDRRHGALALLRIPSITCVDCQAELNLSPDAVRDVIDDLHPLRQRGILGRVSQQPGQAIPANKIDLGIGSEADGVSRRVARVTRLSVDGMERQGQRDRNSHTNDKGPHIELKVMARSTTLKVQHYAHGRCAASSRSSGRCRYYGHDSEACVMLGDVLVFDHYRRRRGGLLGFLGLGGEEPRHIFRLVRYDVRGLE